MGFVGNWFYRWRRTRSRAKQQSSLRSHRKNQKTHPFTELSSYFKSPSSSMSAHENKLRPCSRCSYYLLGCSKGLFLKDCDSNALLEVEDCYSDELQRCLRSTYSKHLGCGVQRQSPLEPVDSPYTPRAEIFAGGRSSEPMRSS